MRPSTQSVIPSITHSSPRAGVDPIDRPEVALRAIAMVAAQPPRPETILLFLDGARRGHTIVVVSGTVAPSRVVDVVELLTRPSATGGRFDAVVVGTVRTAVTDAGTAERDIDRWLEISDIAEGHGLEVVEWFVIDPSGVACPRDALGEPPRW